MYFKRLISGKIQQAAETFPAIVLTGARQVGKTTLLREIFPDHHYLSLDLPSVAEAAENDPVNFLARNPSPLILDEIQYAPGIFRALKAMIDQQRHMMGQYILTGSQKFTLMREVSESLAGRAAILELEPLSLRELGDRSDWIHILIQGLYPELWRQPALKRENFYFSYLSTYLERDVRQILNVSSLRDFERFIRAAASRSGQLLNRVDLARDVGVSGKTIGEWVSVLEASNQIFLLEPYFENVGKRLVKSPKLYFSDPGMLCFLLGLDERTLPFSPLLGAIWETFVYAELRKQAANSGSGTQSLWFYRDAQGKELDFLKVNQGRIDLIECKWSETPDPRWFGHLDQIGEIMKGSRSQNVGKKILVCGTKSPFLNSIHQIQITNPAHIG